MKRALLIGLVALAGCGSENRVDQVVDQMDEDGDLAPYCEAMEDEDKLGFSEAEAFANFRKGYTLDDPPAADVFAEIRSRCG